MPRNRSPASLALGQAARSLRVERGIAQEAFARRTGMDRSNYGAIERGELNVRLDTIVKIAAGLEISAAALLERARL
jgi:transcriptional regulator with XRE-family HTH domain